MKLTRQHVAKVLREIPEAMSLLYDLDLMPEQVASDSKEEAQMQNIVQHFDKLNRRLKGDRS